MFWRGLGDSGSGDNRRRAGRVFTHHVECSLGTVLDLSATGLRVRTGMRPGVVVGEVFWMTIGGYSGKFQVKCQCAWVKKAGWFSHEVGIHFLEVDPESRAHLTEIGRSANTNADVGEDVDKLRRAS